MATRLYEQSESLEELFRRTLGALALLAIPCTAGLWLTAEDLIELIFGPEFQASVAVLKVLAPLLLVSFLSQFLGALLTACGRQAKRTRSQWIAASVNLGAMFVLIPAFGVVGAAIATLGAESLLALLYALRLRSVLRLSVPWGHILLSLGASLSFCLLFGFVLDTSLILVVPGSAILYLGIVLLSGSVRRNEVSALISVLRGRDA
jgi:O-antigen/teichoic acid export membrane protein